jgi:hypothetical protein
MNTSPHLHLPSIDTMLKTSWKFTRTVRTLPVMSSICTNKFI